MMTKKSIILGKRLIPSIRRNLSKTIGRVVEQLLQAQQVNPYLIDKKFTLFCDNTAVCYLFSKHNPNQRLQRWIMATQEYTFDIKHITSKRNAVSDALSRYPGTDDESSGETSADFLIDHLLLSEEGVSDCYEEGLVELYQYLARPGSNAHYTNSINVKSLKYRAEGDYLYRLVGQRWLKIPHKQERLQVLQEIHDGHGHFGQHASWARLYKDYWWPGVYMQLREYIASCEPCQLYANVTDDNPPSRSTINGLKLFEQFAIDF
jgi:hypothetical protein